MNINSKYKPLLYLAAICSFLGALTTALLIFLPNPQAADPESQALLFQNHLYLSKLWILFLHPQFNIIASLGVAFLLLKKYPLQIIVGTFFLLVWAITEMTQQALLIESASGISDSLYFMVIYGFGLGTLLYGLAFIHMHGWAKWIGVALVFIGLLSLASFARYYMGATQLNAIANASYEWIYPYLQPLVRIAIGIWIIKAVRNNSIL